MAIDYDYIIIEGFLVKQRSKKAGHVFIKAFKKHSFPYYYQKCGLVKLNNQATQKAINKGCIHYFDEIVGKI
jgi:hypothetical protein